MTLVFLALVMSGDKESEELAVFSSAGFLLRGVTADSSNWGGGAPDISLRWAVGANRVDSLCEPSSLR